MLKFLGKIGKGFGTITGIAVLVLGALGKTEAAQQLPAVTDALANTVMLVGGLLASFGIGRKGGAAAAGN